MSGAAEIHHSTAVVANLQKKSGMPFAQIRVNEVVGTSRVVADVGGVGTVHQVRACELSDRQAGRIWRRVRMIFSVAALSNQITIVLEHVYKILDHNSRDCRS